MSKIGENYNPALNKSAGHVVLSDPAPPGKPLGKDGETLLALLHWLTYTKDGRTYLEVRPAPPLPNDPKEAIIRKDLKDEFAKRGEKRDVVVEALIESHLAGSRWVQANKLGDMAERDKQESIYKQAVSVITWALWEDGIGHEFSMLW